MDRSTASAYVYAKACGMFSKTFVGKRTNKLFEAKNLKDLWTMIFSTTEVPVLPEGQLADKLEGEVSKKIIAEFLSLVSSYDKPDLLSLALISKYDYTNLKTAWHILFHKEDSKDFLIDISPFSIFNWSKWPNLHDVVKHSPISPSSLPDLTAGMEERVFWDTELDRIYYRSLWDALKSLPVKDRQLCKPLISTEIILQNIVWIFRLRVYYGYKTEQIKPLLFGVREESTEKLFCKPAYFAFDRSLDDWKDWKDWHYAWLLNPHEEGSPWILDPRWAQLKADRYIYKMATRLFRISGFTVGTLVAFFKIKHFEEYMIRVAAESLRVGTDDFFKSEIFGDNFYV